jgi:carbonic anhydrase
MSRRAVANLAQGGVAIAVGLTIALAVSAQSPDWSYCHGLAPSTAANGTVVCPAGWHSRYPGCSGGVQSPPNFALGSSWVDAQLRPFDLNWVVSQEVSLAVVPGVSLTATPLDIKPALWEPNEGAAYALQHVEFASPSLHAMGGGRHDLEVIFVHTRRDDEEGPTTRLAVSMLFDASPIRPENEGLRNLAYPVLVQGTASVNASIVQKQRAAYAALAPASRDYTLYDGASATPPCYADTRHVVMHEVGGVSQAQVERIRAAIGLSARSVDGVMQADGNVRPLQPWPAADDSWTGARRFVDYAGAHLFNAEPKAAPANKRVEDFAVAALALSCIGLVTALLAARLSQA